MNEPLKVILVGAGNRSMTYASYALDHPDELKIVGVAEPVEVRRKEAQKLYNIPDEMCFESCEELCKQEKLADAVINGTMDTLHLETSVPLLRKGYDMLLEKPFVLSEEEMDELVAVVKETGRKVMICHVLRYAPFYRKIKEIVASGEIGDVYSIHMTEHVAWHHMLSAYMRGKWASPEECGSPILLAKACHDIDLMMWMMGDVKPTTVYSVGGDFKFAKGKKPENAGTRCLVDCPIEKDCIYSARRNYLVGERRWAGNVWGEAVINQDPLALSKMNFTDEEREDYLKRAGNYGRCAWDCDRGSNIENQSILFTFENGGFATFNLVGGAPGAQRAIQVIGTKGEVRGIFDNSTYEVRKPVPESESGHVDEVFNLQIEGDMIGLKGGHGGGDLLLVEDFVKYMQGGAPSISCTELEQSVVGHKSVFRAEESRKTKRIMSVYE